MTRESIVLEKLYIGPTAYDGHGCVQSSGTTASLLSDDMISVPDKISYFVRRVLIAKHTPHIFSKSFILLVHGNPFPHL